MYTITTRQLDPIEGYQPFIDYILANSATGEWATVLPAFGGILRQLVLRQGEKRYKVIDTASSPQALVADETYASALLYPFPSRVFQGVYRFEGEAYALPLNETRRSNALHGFVHGKPFRVVREEVTAAHAQLSVQYDYPGDLVGYPFPFALTATYTLSEQGLALDFMAMNTGQSRCPAAFGWHPYFTLNNADTDDLELTLPVQTEIHLDQHMIPNGQRPATDAHRGPASLKEVSFDTPFVVDPQRVNAKNRAETVVHWPAESVSLVVEQSADFPYLVIYTPGRRDSIAIEPLTANVDSFNNGEGLTILSPGESLTGSIVVGLNQKK
ncbi:aldose 1-epimerase [Fibrella aquatilis]|uniref:Aldose 1-epimerase n=1 Tax=Fibrella aquatilis TaxID=2817059 RepID=A0A939GC27_9BACT|nr:aldose 1-epimerase [Fibrella aquatilis]MBO0934805.1 aldose 1-epimerase [Fibrella aquatilis]